MDNHNTAITIGLGIAAVCLVLSAYYGMRIHLPGDDQEHHMRNRQRSLALLLAAMTMAFAPMIMDQRTPIIGQPDTVAG